ncbi:MAG: hypothetical protein IPG93_24975 [Burkholderiales bacterium]|nr:hypothetical protein [Burkholderiales bacterium]
MTPPSPFRPAAHRRSLTDLARAALARLRVLGLPATARQLLGGALLGLGLVASPGAQAVDFNWSTFTCESADCTALNSVTRFSNAVGGAAPRDILVEVIGLDNGATVSTNPQSYFTSGGIPTSGAARTSGDPLYFAGMVNGNGAASAVSQVRYRLRFVDVGAPISAPDAPLPYSLYLISYDTDGAGTTTDGVRERVEFITGGATSVPMGSQLEPTTSLAGGSVAYRTAACTAAGAGCAGSGFIPAYDGLDITPNVQARANYPANLGRIEFAIGAEVSAGSSFVPTHTSVNRVFAVGVGTDDPGISTSADMSVVLANVPATVRPGLSVAGMTATCRNASGGAAAVSPTCTVVAGTTAAGITTPLALASLTCTPTLGPTLAAAGSTVCTFSVNVPGTQGGTNEPTTTFTVTATTSASNDLVAANNSATTSSTVLDTVDDAVSLPGGLIAQTFNLATNDDVPADTTFTIRAGSTYGTPSVSSAGVATFDVPASSTCAIPYQLCSTIALATTCDFATLTVTAEAADMSAAFSNVPAAVGPGQVVSGVTLTCTNGGASAATAATCVPSLTSTAGGTTTPLTLTGLTCSATPTNVTVAGSIVCTFGFAAPGTAGGADTTTTQLNFSGATNATNDSVAGNNTTTASSTVVDALNDTTGVAGGLTGQTFNVATNDQAPVGSTFTRPAGGAGGTCTNASMSTAGLATFDVPATGACTVEYQVCAASPTTACDNATLTVTAQSADMSAAFSNVPAAVGPGQVVSGVTLTCTNGGASAATAATCVPSLTSTAGGTTTPLTLTGLTCSATPTNVAVSGSIVCTFGFTAPGTTGGLDNSTTQLNYLGVTNATNDGVAANNTATASSLMVDALNDTTSVAGGLTGQTFNVATNDQVPAGATFTRPIGATGGTCLNASMSTAGLATFDVPATGACTVEYQVCAASPTTACDNATLTVTAQAADMSAAFSNVPAAVGPGQVVSGVTLTCTNGGAATATAATCVPSLTSTAGGTTTPITLTGLTCSATPTNVAVAGSIVCSFGFTAPGTAGGADTTTTQLNFSGATNATNDSNVANNTATASSTVVDALNDTTGLPGGLSAQTFNVATNDQVPAGATFTRPAGAAGGTCLNASTSTAGLATFDVPASGTCTVEYQVCAASPTSACDNATLTVTAQAADMSAAFSNVPAAVGPGQVVSGVTLTCTNGGASAATAATCVPSLTSTAAGTTTPVTITGLTCSATPTNVAVAGSIVCTFGFTAPGTTGGLDNSTTQLNYLGLTNATNDGVAANNTATASSLMVDALNDTTSLPGGLTGQTFNVATNDQVPAGATFTRPAGAAGGTCLNASMSTAGLATFDVPATGACTVEYQVCAASPTTACDNATLTVTAQSADMSAAFSNVPAAVGPGQVVSGVTLTCTNVGASAATAATCVPSLTSTAGGTTTPVSITGLTCSATPTNVAVSGSIVCTFGFTAPGTAGGADTTTTLLNFSGATNATNDSVAGNNTTTASSTVVDALNDTTGVAGGLTGQTFNVATNDQFPIGSTFTRPAGAPGGTCTNASMSTAGLATFDVPATGACTVEYQVCAVSPTTACDNATLTVTAQSADMSAAFSNVPAAVGPGQVVSGVTLTCSNIGAGAATAATCLPSLTSTAGGTTTPVTITGLTCSATPTNVAVAGSIVCTFGFTVPGTAGGADTTTTQLNFLGATNATNDGVAGNNTATASSTVVDALNDTTGVAGGLTGQTFDVATNDQAPAGATFTRPTGAAGGTCLNASMSTAGLATFDVPATGTCTVEYQVCAASPATACDNATLTVTAQAADMSAAFSNVPAAVGPGQVVSGVTLTCSNIGAAAATAATCLPSLTSTAGGTTTPVAITGLTCSATPTNVAVAGSIVCSFGFTAPGTAGGADTTTTQLNFSGATNATNDSNAGNNTASASSLMVDALNDTTNLPGGLTGQTFNVATNDQSPAGATFTRPAGVTGGTCLNASMSTAGLATFDVPATGACTVEYQVCAASPTTACDNATLTVTAQAADMSAAFSNVPAAVGPGQVVSGVTLTCTNVGASAATAATCVPSLTSTAAGTTTPVTITGLTCSATPTNVAVAGSIVCTFGFAAPGTAGGADTTTTQLSFSGATNATNDSVAGNNTTTASSTVVDALNDTTGVAGGLTGQTFNVATNDQAPVGSTFTRPAGGAGGTCTNASMSTAGLATFDVPATGTCTVDYQVCAASPTTACDNATLTVTAQAADMSAAFSNVPAAVGPGQIVSGVTLTCSNIGAGAATAATCVPSLTSTAGGTTTPVTITGLTCSATPTNVAVAGSIVCTFGFTAPGTAGGADTTTTLLNFSGATNATNDSNVANNTATASSPVVDALNDTTALPGGLTGQTFNVATNDQAPVGSTFTRPAGAPGGTCLNASMSTAGLATFDVPATGACTVEYQVCAASPTTACDNATLTVTAQAADMSAAFGNVPVAVGPGQVVSGVTLTCSNIGAGAATAATCLPSLTSTAGGTTTPITLTGLTCSAIPTNVAVAGSIVCTFGFTAPGTTGGLDTTTTQLNFSGATNATNDGVAGNNTATASSTVVDALNDTTGLPGGLSAQTFNVATNDQAPVGSTFTRPAGAPGGTCLNASMSTAGLATFDVPATGACTVEYQVCAASPTTACDNATLTVTAQAADMSAAFSNVPAAVGPGQVVSGVTLTCSNVGASAATAATCVPSLTSTAAGTTTPVTITGLTCSATPINVAVAGSIVCTFGFTAPGTAGGADTTTTQLNFLGATNGTNDGVAGNNTATASSTVVDALNDTTGLPGGLSAQTFNVATNDQAPVGSTFTRPAGAPGGTCLNASMSTAGLATFDVPATGACTVEYQVCAASPTTACDNATLTVTAQAADMSAAFSNVPAAVGPGQVVSGVTLTCSNIGAGAATAATCLPSLTSTAGGTTTPVTITGLTCSATPTNVAVAGSIVCTFGFTAPGTAGGLDNSTTQLNFSGVTNATNDGVAANNTATASSTIVDALTDTTGLPGGLSAQTFNVATNDQVPAGATFTRPAGVTGGTCLNASMSTAGLATFDVPATGACTVEYQVCAVSPTTACDNATLTVTAQSADMSAAFSNVPAAFGPGQVVSGVTLTCTNVGASAATAATCVPSLTSTAGGTTTPITLTGLTCSATPTNVAVAGSIVCTFGFTAPGTAGGADTTTTQLNFSGATNATNDSNAGNNTATASSLMVDALNDTTSVAGGLTGQTLNVATNDQSPAGATFTRPAGAAGGTCLNASMSTAGLATFDVPATGTCTVEYQVCAASPTAACDNATLTVTAQGADMSAAITNMPSVLAPGQVVSGVTLTCSNAAGGAVATAATCVPGIRFDDGATTTAVTPTGQICTSTPTGGVAAGDSVVCTFGFTTPGTAGGSNEAAISLIVSGSTGATNDGNPANNNASVTSSLIDAVDDALVSLPASGGRVTVLGNDSIGATTVLPSQVSLTLVDTAGLSGLTVDATTGELVVASGATVGSFQVTYRICSVLAGATSACDSAKVTIQIQGADVSPRITGLPSLTPPGSTVTGTLSCSNAGPGVALQANCTATGASLSACTVTTAGVTTPVTLPVASLASGAVISCTLTATTPSTGKLTITGTSSAGNDTVPGNDQVTADIAVIDAVDDGPANLPAAGGRVPLYPNDSIGGVAVTPAQVGSTIVADGGLTGASIDQNTGDLLVPAGNPAGTYRVTYRLCAAAPQAATCDTAIATVVVGGTADLTVSKSHSPALFTEGQPGRYEIVVRNLGVQATLGSYTVFDTLPAGMTLAAIPTGTGWNCSASVVGSSSASCTSTGVIAVGQTAPTIALTVTVATGACRTPDAGGACSGAASLVNHVTVTGGGDPDDPTSPNNRHDDPTPVQQAGAVSGAVWLDANHNRVFDAGDVAKPGLIVEILDSAGQVVGSAITQAQGQYRVDGLLPGSGYTVRFRDPVSGAYYGRPISNDPQGGNDPSADPRTGVVTGGAIQGISIPPGVRSRINQNLPLDPSGVVYSSHTRLPLAGVTVELLSGGVLVPPICVVGGINQLTTSIGGGAVDGAYSFLLQSPVPAGCPGAADYTLRLTTPPGYALSSLIAPQPGTLVPPAGCSNGGGAICLVQAQNAPPTGNQPTPYYLSMSLDPNGGTAVINNHIALDATGTPQLVVSKTGSVSNAEIGDSVRYKVLVRRTDTTLVPVDNVELIDNLPLGFRYIPGTAQLTYLATGANAAVTIADPIGAPGAALRFSLGALGTGNTLELSYRVRIGAGADLGNGINRAQATTVPGTGCLASSGAPCSNESSHRVRVGGGVFSSDACVVGKVYTDCNHNHVQDAEELGIPGVRLVMLDGSSFVTDIEGKYSVCGLQPRTQVMVIDQSTLPRGSRLGVSSNRNAGDAASLFIDLKNGELHRADFIEASCSNSVTEQVKARRSRGESGAVETEKAGGRVLKFDGKPYAAPQRATDSARQRGDAKGQGQPGIVKPRQKPGEPPPGGASTSTGQTINTPLSAQPTSSGATQPEEQP